MAVENPVVFAEIGNPKRVTQLTENTSTANAYFLTEKAGEPEAKKTAYATVENAVNAKIQSEYLKTLSVTPSETKTMSEKLEVAEFKKRDDKIVVLDNSVAALSDVKADKSALKVTDDKVNTIQTNVDNQLHQQDIDFQQKAAAEFEKNKNYVDNKSIEIAPLSVTPETLSEATKQYIEGSGGGTITNLADDEDLVSQSNVLKFKDKAYQPSNFSGLGRKMLRKNIDKLSGKNILTQEMINQPNTIYEIQYDFDLNGETITIPEGCILSFSGGSFFGGNVILVNTYLSGSPKFKDTDINGSVHNDSINVQWLGAKGDNIANDTIAVQRALNFGGNIYFPIGIYTVDTLRFTNIKDAFVVKGDGIGASVVKFSSSAEIVISSSKFVDSMTIKNITFDGANVCNAIKISKHTNCFLQKAEFSNFITGLIIERSYQAYIQACVFKSDNNTVSNLLHLKTNAITITQSYFNTGGKSNCIYLDTISDAVKDSCAINIIQNTFEASISCLKNKTASPTWNLNIEGNYFELVSSETIPVIINEGKHSNLKISDNFFNLSCKSSVEFINIERRSTVNIYGNSLLRPIIITTLDGDLDVGYYTASFNIDRSIPRFDVSTAPLRAMPTVIINNIPLLELHVSKIQHPEDVSLTTVKGSIHVMLNKAQKFIFINKYLPNSGGVVNPKSFVFDYKYNWSMGKRIDGGDPSNKIETVDGCILAINTNTIAAVQKANTVSIDSVSRSILGHSESDDRVSIYCEGANINGVSVYCLSFEMQDLR